MEDGRKSFRSLLGRSALFTRGKNRGKVDWRNIGEGGKRRFSEKEQVSGSPDMNTHSSQIPPHPHKQKNADKTQLEVT